MAKLKRPIRKPKRSPGEQTGRDEKAKSLMGWRKSALKAGVRIRSRSSPRNIRKLKTGSMLPDRTWGKPPKSGSAKLKP